MSMQTPSQWPKEVCLVYEPIRVLGKGGFGSVVLARRRSDAPVDTVDADATPEVAIKIVGSSEVSDKDVGYAHRELDILTELSHPNIMKLLCYWEPAPEEHLCAAVMVLSLAKGPTLHDLIRNGGAVGFVFGRVVIAQLIDALSYIHSRAVVHRDIKGDNVIVSGATLEQDEIWDNDCMDDCDWGALIRKWHVTLIDFGFARALTPADMKKKPPKGDPSTALDVSTGSASSRSLKRSMSRQFKRQMSAVGNRDYAAPEITQKVQVRDPSMRGGRDILHTISKHQAYYGLQVDAYSLGVLIRFALTGVPPHENVQEFIAMHNSPLLRIAKVLCCSKKKEGEREIQYRSYKKIPGEVLRMIRGLTHYDPQQRTSIRTARRYPWVDDVIEGSGPGTTDVDYLNLVKSKSVAEDGSTDPAEHEA